MHKTMQVHMATKDIANHRPMDETMKMGQEEMSHEHERMESAATEAEEHAMPGRYKAL